MDNISDKKYLEITNKVYNKISQLKMEHVYRYIYELILQSAKITWI